MLLRAWSSAHIVDLEWTYIPTKKIKQSFVPKSRFFFCNKIDYRNIVRVDDLGHKMHFSITKIKAEHVIVLFISSITSSRFYVEFLFSSLVPCYNFDYERLKK